MEMIGRWPHRDAEFQEYKLTPNEVGYFAERDKYDRWRGCIRNWIEYRIRKLVKLWHTL